MQRVPEPELMLDEAQALAYAQADFEAAHSRIVAGFAAAFPALPSRGSLVDLGCGPGDITLRLARANPGWAVEGIDGSPAMLALARAALAQEPSLAARVRFTQALLPIARPAPARFAAVFSNSLLHQLLDPNVLWSSIRHFAAPGAAVYVADLFRPASVREAEGLVRRYVANEPEVLRRDYRNSLLAAFTVDEVRQQLADAGFNTLETRAITDRHLVVCGCLPGV